MKGRGVVADVVDPIFMTLPLYSTREWEEELKLDTF
jgi:hypothetical protein